MLLAGHLGRVAPQPAHRGAELALGCAEQAARRRGEDAGGRFHNDTWFALAWGGFPAFTGYFVNALTIRPAGILTAAACCLLSAAQRQLSTPVRRLRRDTTEVTGQQHLRDGSVIELTRAGLSAPLEAALRTLWLALVLLAIGLVALRV